VGVPRHILEHNVRLFRPPKIDLHFTPACPSYPQAALVISPENALLLEKLQHQFPILCQTGNRYFLVNRAANAAKLLTIKQKMLSNSGFTARYVDATCCCLRDDGICRAPPYKRGMMFRFIYCRLMRPT
jgi:hypothetical protein